tara:strand:+ start:282 stop:791 length:510 start_codon:yes stop_codon:yes gene_type:complete
MHSGRIRTANFKAGSIVKWLGEGQGCIRVVPAKSVKLWDNTTDFCFGVLENDHPDLFSKITRKQFDDLNYQQALRNIRIGYLRELEESDYWDDETSEWIMKPKEGISPAELAFVTTCSRKTERASLEKMMKNLVGDDWKTLEDYITVAELVWERNMEEANYAYENQAYT